MDTLVQFCFRGQHYRAEAFFSFEKEPCYIFLLLRDEELIREFGDDITIKTDCEGVLPKKDGYPSLDQLRQTLFDSVKTTRAFLCAKARFSKQELSCYRKLKNY